MKILHVDTEKGWRGGEQQLLYLIRGLREKGIKCAVACRVKGELEERCKAEGFKVIPLKGNQTSDVLRLGIVGREFDIVHAHSAKAHTISALSKGIHKRPLIYTRRVDYKPKDNFITSFKYRKTDKVVAISFAVKGILKECYPWLEPEVIPSVVDSEEIERRVNPERVREIKGEFKGEPLIGTLAALTHQKDIPNFIEAASIVLKELPKAKFVVFGEGKLRKELQRLIEVKGLKGRFKLFGFVEDVPNYTKALDIFVLPSRNEGLGSSILIAMALKVPVIATKVGGTVEVVKDGETGILVPPSNPRALAEAILGVSKRKDLREELTKKAYALVKERFSVESMVNSYLKVYGEVLK
ncbi:glycosyltransferase involved in cell wall biosynthesis [Thermovibrio guaymasensis]|uniref:Glycosyltransferase involved in cell wall biosynthesis n=1 Tax=Thermovibrio guaymasensis TaxID=240167 RepID=A0A420W5T6_9BACT|nr:glycosyltransferase family 4 protein [Thermovibrio guaymasensis]RKQ60409.1 glycosyltransferase involved in cell wall biosynthesis [Thermovibrio guaymasensis]